MIHVRVALWWGFVILAVGKIISVVVNTSPPMFIGYFLGFGWMLYNIRGYLFNKDMSLRGAIPFSNEGDRKILRGAAFFASLTIYAMLIFS